MAQEGQQHRQAGVSRRTVVNVDAVRAQLGERLFRRRRLVVEGVVEANALQKGNLRTQRRVAAKAGCESCRPRAQSRSVNWTPLASSPRHITADDPKYPQFARSGAGRQECLIITASSCSGFIPR
eukprot:365596-Chlamydomonas_euryale.AAC.7